MKTLLSFLLASVALASPPIRPDPKLTPGVSCPTITAQDLVPGYTAKVRANGTPDGAKITDATKAKVYAEYGITVHRPGDFEIDHLISLELGGSNDIKNLWPQSYHGTWNAHMKDRLENEIHRRVVAGTMKLADAQRMIAHDWIALYRLTFPNDLDAAGVPFNQSAQPNAEPDK